MKLITGDNLFNIKNDLSDSTTYSIPTRERDFATNVHDSVLKSVWIGVWNQVFIYLTERGEFY